LVRRRLARDGFAPLVHGIFLHWDLPQALEEAARRWGQPGRIFSRKGINAGNYGRSPLTKPKPLGGFGSTLWGRVQHAPGPLPFMGAMQGTGAFPTLPDGHEFPRIFSERQAQPRLGVGAEGEKAKRPFPRHQKAGVHSKATVGPPPAWRYEMGPPPGLSEDDSEARIRGAGAAAPAALTHVHEKQKCVLLEARMEGVPYPKGRCRGGEGAPVTTSSGGFSEGGKEGRRGKTLYRALLTWGGLSFSYHPRRVVC